MFWMVLTGLAILIGLLLLVWSLWIEPRSVRILRYQVEIDGIEHPLRTLVISDLQPNDFHWPPERMGELFKELGHENPDLVFWLGDYFNAADKGLVGFLERHPRIRKFAARHSPVMEEIAHEMGRLNGRLGSVAVLGNHDYAWSADQTRTELEAVGITVLVNDIVRIQDPETGQVLEVLGYDDVSSQPAPDFAGLHEMITPDSAAVTLSHSPDAFAMVDDGPSLMLCGHTHGGQVRLPMLGAVVMPVKNKKYDRGWFFEAGRSLLVITGLGTSLPPFRFLCRPEVAVLDFIPPMEM